MRLIIIIAVLTLSSCDAPQSNPSVAATVQAASKLRYFQDDRTGLCFAAMAQMNGNTWTAALNITWVPCEPKVLEIIKSK